jgi:hypothetical protein
MALLLLRPRVVTPTLLRNTALAALMMAGASGTGCSYLFVSAPPAYHEKMAAFDCTSGNAWPVLDTVVAAAYGIGSLNAMTDRSVSDWRKTALATALVAAAFGSSAAVGYRRTQDCRDAVGKLALRMDFAPRTAPAGDQRWLEAAPDPWLQPGPGTPGPAADAAAWTPVPSASGTGTSPLPAGAGAPATSPPAAPSPDAGAAPNSNVPQPNPQED